MEHSLERHTGGYRIVSEVTGRPIRRVVVSDSSHLLAHGSPEPMVNMYLEYFAASRQGEFATVDPTLARLIGRPPLTLRDAVFETTRNGPLQRLRVDNAYFS